ncbi:helix-turn-helix transcriptional regulator [Paracoccus aminovorans]|uniref:helix-turn-helix transcriptional regulator n=1 Tax=Paracoccus aminovorans TaxID=34004 RepID=UPI002B260F9C|nr:helix-turn-helix transcriptional regulator [Paracoccus aminovorans]
MVDLIEDVEARRQAARMSQAEIARELGISQGQLSKVMARKVALTSKMTARMSRWLGKDSKGAEDLDQEILKKCIELMHLLQRRHGSNGL